MGNLSTRVPLVDADGRLGADGIARGVMRLLAELGLAPMVELVLPSGRRIDVAALGPKGEVVFVEIKASLADFLGDRKWGDYVEYCDRLYFAVEAGFPLTRLPEGEGVIVADRFGAAIVGEGAIRPLAAARRKSLTLLFARAAALRTARAWVTPEQGL